LPQRTHRMAHASLRHDAPVSSTPLNTAVNSSASDILDVLLADKVPPWAQLVRFELARLRRGTLLTRNGGVMDILLLPNACGTGSSFAARAVDVQGSVGDASAY
jgi:hypothetical protein